MLSLLLVSVAAAGFAGVLAPAFAQAPKDFPSKPVTLISFCVLKVPQERVV